MKQSHQHLVEEEIESTMFSAHLDTAVGLCCGCSHPDHDAVCAAGHRTTIASRLYMKSGSSEGERLLGSVKYER